MGRKVIQWLSAASINVSRVVSTSPLQKCVNSIRGCGGENTKQFLTWVWYMTADCTWHWTAGGLENSFPIEKCSYKILTLVQASGPLCGAPEKRTKLRAGWLQTVLVEIAFFLRVVFRLSSNISTF